ncbi:MAG: T9SS type A sorting domain-containing protein [Flavobacteriia bacterium]|nr:T9SS type A sorting domain-containing protein [Flavobacteriia bacterium]
MNTKLIFIILIFINFEINAQNEFWPSSNAVWYYNYTDNQWFEGFSKYKIDRDTIINSKVCQIYTKKAKWIFSGFPELIEDSSFQNTFAVLTLQDSVLLKYNFRLNEFDTIINFIANVGDTWRTVIEDSICLPFDKYITTEVIEKNIINVNGRNLIKFKLLRNVPDEYGNNYFEDFHQYFGSDYLFVHNYICVNLDYSLENKLRCFNNHNLTDPFNYYSDTLDCEFISELLSLKNNFLMDKIIFYPNPSENFQTQIFGINTNDIENVFVYDLLGNIIPFNITIVKNSMFLTLFNKISGIYFVKIQSKKRYFFKKIIMI